MGYVIRGEPAPLKPANPRKALLIKLARMALMLAGLIMSLAAGLVFLLRACGIEIGLGGYPGNIDQGIGWLIIAGVLALCFESERQT